jgi:hypothetical protein
MESFYRLAAYMLLLLALLPGEVLCQQVIGSAGFKFNPSRDLTWSDWVTTKARIRAFRRLARMRARAHPRTMRAARARARNTDCSAVVAVPLAPRAARAGVTALDIGRRSRYTARPCGIVKRSHFASGE